MENKLKVYFYYTEVFMSGFWLIVLLFIAIVVMILAISKLKIHPFLAILAVSLLFGLAGEFP
jgi:gluconate:H+ symporter, GntP family